MERRDDGRSRAVARASFPTLVLIAGITGSVLAMGSIDTPVLLAITIVFAAACGLLWWNQEPGFVPRPAANVVLAVGVGLTLLTLIQCVPLPARVLSILSPHAAEVWRYSLEPFAEPGPAYATLSLDPTATRIEVLRGIAYLLVFVSVLRVARHSDGAVKIERALVVSGTLVATVALGHSALGMSRVYGFYLPQTGVTAIAPLMNENHLAAYVNIAIVLCFASVFAKAPMLPRPILVAIFILLGGSELWFASRGGIGSLVAGIMLVLLFVPRRDRSRLVAIGAPLIAVLTGVALIVFAAAAHVSHQLLDTDVSKPAIAWRVLVRMVPSYPLFGVGRGAFESTYPEFREGIGFIVWTHPENIVAQWLGEWGLPAGLISITALIYALRPSVATSRPRPPIGPWVALVTLALHNLVDFSLEVPAVAIAAASCVGLVVAGTTHSTRSRVGRWAASPNRLVLAAVVATLISALLVLTRAGELFEDRRELIVAAQPNSAVTHDEFRARLRAATLAHPAEPYFPFLGAQRVEWEKSGSVMPWIARVLDRAPVYPPAHLVLARSLRRRSPAQARMEYRIYEEQIGGQLLPVHELASLVESFDDAMEVAPSGSQGADLLEAISVLVAARLPSTRAQLDAEILRRTPNAVEPRLRAARDAFADVGDACWCEGRDRVTCLRDATSTAQQAVRVAPQRCAGHSLLARTMAAEGNVEGGITELRTSAAHVTDRGVCLHELASLAIEYDRANVATEAIDALARSTCNEDTACVDNLLVAAQLELTRGNKNRALVFTRRAAAAAPDDDEVALRLARGTSDATLHAESAQVYDRLAAKHPNDASYRVRAEQERALALSRP